MSDAPSLPGGSTDVDIEDDDAGPLSPGRRTARALALGVMVVIAGLWIYALWVPKDTTPPGRMSDRTYSEAAQPICTDAAAIIDALPPAYTSPDAGARADVVAEANVALQTMLVRLEGIAPPASSGTDGRMIQEWLGDWRTYLGDREAYVTALETDPNARFFVTEKEGGQITKPIDFFATYNEMTNCVTPGDLA